LALLAGPSPLGEWLANSSLAVHMLVEHGLLLGAGALAAVGLQHVLPAVRAALVALGAWRTAGAAVFLAVLCTWHVPVLFGAAVESLPLHAVMHICYLLAGFSLVVALPALGAFGRVLLLLGLQALMVVLALAMYTSAITYPPYPPSQTATAGIAMMLGMQVLIPLIALAPRLEEALR
ncbi:MAG: DUF1404 family protein, partial [Candidatus Dormibacteria bacterium]